MPWRWPPTSPRLPTASPSRSRRPPSPTAAGHGCARGGCPPRHPVRGDRGLGRRLPLTPRGKAATEPFERNPVRQPDYSRRVVVTGLGVISPVGNDKDTAWTSLLNGVSGL